MRLPHSKRAPNARAAAALSVASALIALVAVHRVSPWVSLIIVGREFTILGLRVAVESGGRRFDTSMLGK